MTLELNKYENLFTKDNWLAKSPEEQLILALSTELETTKDTNIKWTRVFNVKGTPKGKTNNQFNQKWNKKKTPRQNNDDNYDWEKVPPKQGKNNEWKNLQLV